MINEKSRVYGKTKYISINELKSLFKDKELDFIKIALLFGSRARGDYHTKSDYDFAVLAKDDFKSEWGLKSAIYLKLNEFLGLDDCDIDIVDLKNAQSSIINDIKSCHIILKGSEGEVSRLFAK